MRNHKKRLFCFFFVFLISVAIPGHVFGQPRFESFSHWKVAAVHDHMDATSHVIMRTTFASSEKAAREGQDVEGFFGFRILGGRLITIDGPHAVGRNYWPYCDLNSSTYSIDSSPPQLIATIRAGGSCNAVPMDGDLVHAFKRGGVAYVRLNRVNGYVSLKGFPEAWDRAREFAR